MSVSFRFGTVTAVDPALRVQLEGDTGELPTTPASVARVEVGDPVLCLLWGRRLLLLGVVGGEAPHFDVEVTGTDSTWTGKVTAANEFAWSSIGLSIKAIDAGTDYLGVFKPGSLAGPFKVGSLVIGDSYAPDAPAEGLHVQGAALFDGTVTSDGIYNATSTFTANVGIATSPQGQLYRITSSARYKTGIRAEEVTDDAVRALTPKSYLDLRQWDGNGRTEAGLPRYLGLIAEEVAAVPGLADLLVTYDEDDRPDAVSYDRVAVALIPTIQRLLDRVDQLEAQVAAMTTGA